MEGGKGGEWRDVVECTDCVNAVFWCMGPKHQFDHYWREARFDLCQRQFKELKYCVGLKFADRERAQEMLCELVRETPSPTEGFVWRRRRRQGEEGGDA